MARRKHIPAYRLHKASGRAVVTLPDALSAARKDKRAARKSPVQPSHGN